MTTYTALEQLPATIDGRKCNAPSAAHDARRVARYYVPASSPRLTRWLCQGCLEGLTAMGMDWRPERRTNPVRPDRGRIPRFAAAFRRLAS